MTAPTRSRDGVARPVDRGRTRPGWTRNSLWPLSLTHVALVSALVALGWLYVAINVLDWAPASWLRFDRHVRDAAWAPALVSALCAGYFGRWISRDSAMLSPAAGRGLDKVTAALIAALSLSVGVVSLVAVGVLALVVASRGADGSGSALSVLSHVAGVLAAVPLGLLLARIAPGRVWPLVTLAGTALVMFLPLILTDTVLRDTGLSTLSVSITWGISAPDTGWAVPATVSLLRMGYFALLFLPCTIAAGAVVRRGSLQDRIRFSVPTLIPAALLVVIALVSPNLHLVTSVRTEMVCTDPARDVTVCLGSDDRALLPDISQTVTTLTSLLPPGTRLLVSAPVGTPEGSSRTIWLPEVGHASTRANFNQQLARDVSVELLSPGDCEVLENAAVPAEYWRGVLSKMLTTVGAQPEQTGVVEATLEPVFGNGYDRFAPLSREEFTAWLGEHIEQVRDCSLTESDLP